MTVEQITLYGWWAKMSSCEEYLREGQVFLMILHSLAKDAWWSVIDLVARNSLVAWRLLPNGAGFEN